MNLQKQKIAINKMLDNLYDEVTCHIDNVPVEPAHEYVRTLIQETTDLINTYELEDNGRNPKVVSRLWYQLECIKDTYKKDYPNF